MNMNDSIKIDERHEFGSLAELIKDNLRWNGAPVDGASSHERGGTRFNDFTESYDAAVKLTQNGWREGAKRVESLRRDLDDAVQTLVAAKAANMVYAVDGDWVDVGRLVTGDPECCGSWHIQGDDRNEKVIKVVANVSVSCAVNAETIFARGAACLAAVDIIESLGKRVELWIGLGLNDCGKRIETHVLVKPASQPLELDRLAFTLCHASMLRRVLFAHMELNRHNPCRTYPGPVWSEDAIILPELKTGRAPGREENIREVIKICELAGIVFNAEDLAGLVSSAL
jgi:hypothetical protein